MATAIFMGLVVDVDGSEGIISIVDGEPKLKGGRLVSDLKNSNDPAAVTFRTRLAKSFIDADKKRRGVAG